MAGRRIDLQSVLRLAKLADYVVPFTIRTITQLHIADALAQGPRSIGQIAAETRTRPDSLYRALRLLSSNGLFAETQPATFALTQLAAPLRSDDPNYLGNIYPMIFSDIEACAYLDHSIRTGEQARAQPDGTAWPRTMIGMPRDPHADQATARADAAAARFAYDLAQFPVVADIGANDDGAFLASMLSAAPGIQGHLVTRQQLFDQLALSSPAQHPPGLKEASAQDVSRIPQISEAPLGRADAYMLRHVIGRLDDDGAGELLRALRVLMPDGSPLIIFEPLMAGPTGDHVRALYDILLLASSSGRARTEDELSAICVRSGLRPARVVHTGLITILEARPHDDPGPPRAMPSQRCQGSEAHPSEALGRLLRLADWITPITLRMIAELGVADYLKAGPLGADELAAMTGTHATGLCLALRTLCSGNIFEEPEPGTFGLTPLAEALRTDHPLSLRGSYPLIWSVISAWTDLAHSLRTGKPAFDKVHDRSLWDYLAADPSASAMFTKGMSNLSRIELRGLLPAYPWASLSSLIDVGGGDATVLAGILARFPNIRGVAFDLPHLSQAAAATLSSSGVAHRCEVVDGDFLHQVPAGRDAYILKRILYGWDDEHALQILRVVRAAMRDDSHILVIEPIAEGTILSPESIRSIDMLMLAIDGGRVRGLEEIRDLFETAGLRMTRVIPTLMFPIIEGCPN